MEQKPTNERELITVNDLDSKINDLDRTILAMKGLATELLPRLFDNIKARGYAFTSDLANNQAKAAKIHSLIREINATYYQDMVSKFEELEKEMGL